MLQAFYWWLVFLLLGLVALPITAWLFRRLPDRGYGFSRALGLLLFGYLFWILGTIRVIPNSRLGAIAVFAVLAAVAFVVLDRQRHHVVAFVKRRWPIILATELVFAAVFAFWAVLRSYTPAIAHTEQPMDFALLNGILQSPHFPPQDPWYAGHSISYYYFGYLMSAGVTQLTGIASAVTYNLSLVAIAGMAAAGVLSLVYNVVVTMRGPGGARASVGTGLLFGGAAVVLLLFMGNLVGSLEYLQANNVGSHGFWSWLGIDGLTGQARGSTWYPSDTFWWWRSTRVINTFTPAGGIDYTITEFPFFSFTLGDLHPHVMSLPFVLMAMAFAYNAVRTPGVWGLAAVRSAMPPNTPHNPLLLLPVWWASTALAIVRRRRWEVVLGILMLGALGFLNSWDLPTFTALFFAALLLRAFHQRARGHDVSFKTLASLMAFVVIGEALLYLPFYAFLRTQAGGILPVRDVMTRQIHYVLVWGPFLVLSLSLLAAWSWDELREPLRRAVQSSALRWAFQGLLPQAPAAPAERQTRLSTSPLFWAIVLPLVPFAIWAGVQFGLSAVEGHLGRGVLDIGSRFWHLLPLFVILGLGLGLLFRKAAKEGARSSSLQFVLLLILFAFLLTMGAELFHIVDRFGRPNLRMNTVFKFYYQAWAMMAVVGAVSLYYWSRRLRLSAPPVRWATAGLAAVFVIFIAASFVYIPAAAYGKAEGFKPSPTLNALASYQASNPQEYDAVQWLRHNAGQGVVVLEGVPAAANGLPEGDYDPGAARISRSTGLPTVLGWPFHEYQWRSGSYAPIARRAQDVDAIYRGPDLVAARRLLRQYDVRYVVVGDLERRLYGLEVAGRFAPFMDIAFENDRVIIYAGRQPS